MTVMRLVSSSKLIKRLLLGGVATVLIAVPAAVDGSHPGIAWQTALAKNDGGQGGGGGNGGGHGNGQGGAHGRGGGHGKGNGLGHGYGHGGANSPDTATYGSFGEFLGKVRNGQSPKSRDEHMTKASGPSAGGFKNHGERTRTMVELAKRLGYGARVGAQQANFGTPFENGIADLQAQLAQAEAAGNQAEVERLERELAQAIENAKPGKGPDNSWATADLDVNDDGMVDKRDLDALDELQVRPASSSKPAR
jgi:hypothetical protein